VSFISDLSHDKVHLPDFDALTFKYSRVIQNCNKDETSLSSFISTCNTASTNEVEKTTVQEEVDNVALFVVDHRSVLEKHSIY
jgi:hypothetical protein